MFSCSLFRCRVLAFSALSGSTWTHPDPCLWVFRSCFQKNFNFNLFPLAKITALGVSMQPIWLEKQASRHYGKTLLKRTIIIVRAEEQSLGIS